MKKGHQPNRMCCSCRKRFVKKELKRYVFLQTHEENGGALAFDINQTNVGRGYYVCNSLECQQKFNKKYFDNGKRKGV